MEIYELSKLTNAFLLFGFVPFCLLLPFFLIQEIKQRSAWSPFILGFLMFSVGGSLNSLSQLFDFSIPRFERLFWSLVIICFSLCSSSLPLLLLRAQLPGRTRIALSFGFGVCCLIAGAGFVVVFDWLLGRLGAGDDRIGSMLFSSYWQPVLAVEAGVFLVLLTNVLARAPIEPATIVVPEAVFEGSFAGNSPGLRKTARVLGALASALTALYCFAFFADAAFGTSLKRPFEPLISILVFIDRITEKLPL